MRPRRRLGRNALSWPPPINSLQVHSEWFVLDYHGSPPTPHARPAVVFRPSHQGGTHRVQVNVIHLLHEEALTEHRHRVGMNPQGSTRAGDPWAVSPAN